LSDELFYSLWCKSVYFFISHCITFVSISRSSINLWPLRFCFRC
jgi:hypothetical protein